MTKVKLGLAAVLFVAAGVVVARAEGQEIGSNPAREGSNDPTSSCCNGWDPISTGCCCEENSSESSEDPQDPADSNTAGRGALNSPGHSLITGYTFTHLHTAEDYRTPSPAGCHSCGGGGSSSSLGRLAIRRTHRTRGLGFRSSFGPGIASNFDTHLTFYRTETANFLDLYNPFWSGVDRFVDGVYPFTSNEKDGVFLSHRTKAAQDVRLYDENGYDPADPEANRSEDPVVGGQALLTLHTGKTFLFDWIDLSGATAADLTTNLQLHLPLNEESGATTVDDVSSGNHDGALQGPAAEKIVDNREAVPHGSWVPAYGTKEQWGHDCLFNLCVAEEGRYVHYAPGMQNEAQVAIWLRVPSYHPGEMATEVPVVVHHTGGDTVVVVDQQSAAGTWASVGSFTLDAESYVDVKTKHGEYEAEGRVYADAMKFVASSASDLWPSATADFIAEGKSGGRSLQFDGVSRVEIDGNGGYQGVSGGDPRTITAWVKTTSGGTVAHWGSEMEGASFQFRVVREGEISGDLAVGALCCDANGKRLTADTSVSDGTWHHVALVLPVPESPSEPVRLNHIRMYVDGALQQVSSVGTGQVDTADASDVWIGNDPFHQTGFVGAIDEVRMYDRPLEREEIAAMLDGESDPVLAGRLKTITDRNGYGFALLYKDQLESQDPEYISPTQIAQSPSRQWQIHTVTDAQGREATFYYGATQVSGRWSVEQIDLPNDQSVSYDYADGFLSGVTWPDETASTFDRAYDLTSHCTQIQFSDRGVSAAHQKKDVYVTNQVSIALHEAKVHPQAEGLTRIVINPEDEVCYYNRPGAEAHIYEGSGLLRQIQSSWNARVRFATSWSVTAEGKIEDYVGEENYLQWTGGLCDSAPSDRTDATGRQTQYTYNDSRRLTRITHPDGTKEYYQYNDFQQPTRYQDRFGRVMKYHYDERGNQEAREVGLVYNSSTEEDDETDAYAVYKLAYYPAENANEFLLRYEYAPLDDLETTPTTADIRKEYLYDEDHYLTEIKEPDDTGAGFHTAAAYDYDDAGRLIASTDACERTTHFFYDDNGRQVETLYADHSTDRTVYYGPASDFAGMLWKTKDRNGLVTEYTYDDAGRKIKIESGHLQQTCTTLPDPETGDLGEYSESATGEDSSVTEYAYVVGTNRLASQTANGERTDYAYDYRGRLVETTSHPRDGQTLTAKSIYSETNELIASEDAYGRKTWYAYDPTMGDSVRTIREAVPDAVEDELGADPDNDDLLTLTRDDGPNAKYAVTSSEPEKVLEEEDAYYDWLTGGTLSQDNDVISYTKSVDARGIVSVAGYDARGRAVVQGAAVAILGSPDTLIEDDTIAARSETEFDNLGGGTNTGDDNVKKVYHPRYFVEDDPGEDKDYATMTYTRRDLPASRTVAAGGTTTGDNIEAGTEEFTYYLDAQRKTHTDFNDNVTTYYYSPCCARLVMTVDAENNGYVNRTDAGGRSIFSAVVPNAVGGSAGYFSYDLGGFETINGESHPTLTFMANLLRIDEDPYDHAVAMTTTRYDARSRTVAATTWSDIDNRPDWPEVLPPGGAGTVPNRLTPPIAGGLDGTGTDCRYGLTTWYGYSDQAVDPDTGLAGSVTVCGKTVDLEELYEKAEDNSIDLDAEADSEQMGDGSAAATLTAVTADGSGALATYQISAAMSDSAGRTVVAGQLDHAASDAPATWAVSKFDATTTLTSRFEDGTEDGLVLISETLTPVNKPGDADDYASNKTYTDGLGRTIDAKDALNKVTEHDYAFRYGTTSTDFVYKVVDPNDVGFAQFADVRGRILKTTDTEGDSTSRTYDVASNVLTATDAKSESTTNVYDVRGRRITQEDRLGKTTAWYYDANSNLLKIVDADAWDDGDSYAENASNPHTLYAYDDINRKVATAYPGHNPAGDPGDSDYDKKEFAYDAAGKLIKSTDQKGEYVDFAFDLAGRLETRKYYNISDVLQDTDTLIHNLASQLVSAEKGRYNNLVEFEYDSVGRPSSETLTVGGEEYTVGYGEYDAAGRLCELDYPDGSAVWRSYTKRHHFDEVDYDSAGVYANRQSVADFTYDDGMRETARALGNSLSVARTYGRDDNLPTRILTTSVTDFQYDWDANKLKEYEDNGPLGFRDNFGYDAEDRLTSWGRVGNNAQSDTWTLSNTGDWTRLGSESQNRVHDDVHQLTQVEGNTLDYDPKGNMLTDEAAQEYTWDQDNHLVAVDVDGDETDDVEYEFDALGRRVKRTADETITVFVYQGWRCIAEYEEDVAAVSPIGIGETNDTETDPQLVRKYVFGEYLDEPLMMINVTYEETLIDPKDEKLGTTLTITETKYYYHRNDIYSVSAMTNAAGTVVERYRYTPYGRPTVLNANGTPKADPTKSEFDNPHLYTGQRWDHRHGNFHYKHRPYRPTIGRMPSRDILPQINPYEYVRSIPTILVDSYGLQAQAAKDEKPSFSELKFEKDPYLGIGEKYTLLFIKNPKSSYAGKYIVQNIEFTYILLDKDEKPLEKHVVTGLDILLAGKSGAKDNVDTNQTVKHKIKERGNNVCYVDYQSSFDAYFVDDGIRVKRILNAEDLRKKGIVDPQGKDIELSPWENYDPSTHGTGQLMSTDQPSVFMPSGWVPLPKVWDIDKPLGDVEVKPTKVTERQKKEHYKHSLETYVQIDWKNKKEIIHKRKMVFDVPKGVTVPEIKPIPNK